MLKSLFQGPFQRFYYAVIWLKTAAYKEVFLTFLQHQARGNL